MNHKQFKKAQALTAFFVSATVAMAVVYNNLILAFAGLLIGALFSVLVRIKTNAVLMDERTQSIGDRASRLTYVILTITVAFLSLVFTMAGRQAKQVDYEALGAILSYITLLSLALYAISYRYFGKKYGETDD